MGNKRPAIDVNASVAQMNKFASTTKSDHLSVSVARIAQRLQQANIRYQPPLTESELRIISLFTKQKAA